MYVRKSYARPIIYIIEIVIIYVSRKRKMSSEQERKQLDEMARQGETVVPGGTGGKSLEAQEHLAQGRSQGGQTRKEQLGTEGYQEMGRKGGRSTKSGGEKDDDNL